MRSSEARRNLWIVTLAAGLSRFGDHFQMLAIASITYSITGSPLATALQMAIGTLPNVLLVRWAGRVADRRNPRWVILWANLAQVGLTLLYLPIHGLAGIFALNFVRSAVLSFNWPANSKLLPQLVGRHNLLRANARRATVMGVVELFGPLLAGWILAQTDTRLAFIFNSLSFLMPALAMLLVRAVHTRPSPRPTRQALRDSEPAGDSGEAWRFLRSRPDLLKLVAAHSAFMLGMWGVNAIFFPYTKDVLNSGTEVLGAMVSAYSGATLITGLITERWGHRMRSRSLLLAGYVAGALVWTGYPLVDTVPPALAISVFDGTIYTLAITLFETVIQEEAPPESLGRISALIRGAEQSAAIAGMVFGGAVATLRSITAGFAWSIAVSLGLLLLINLAMPGGRRPRRA